MCGIVATTSDRRSVYLGLEALAHRGPDARGVARRSGVTLGHARLAVLDLDVRSDQPLHRGRVTVSYNGELWNYLELRRDLEAEGCAFSTAGDTEVVAYALDRWGLGALLRFAGMFAVAWTADDGTLRLARDRFGEVPLHYAADCAASELKALRAMGVQAFSDVGPGEVVTLRAGAALRIERWHANKLPPESPEPLEAIAPMIRAAVIAGVHERTIADVPVCTLLSGGLDSTIIAWAAKQLMPQLVAYTAVQDTRSSDVKMARVAAAALGIELREVSIPLPTADDLSETVAAIEMPYKAQVEIGWACLALARRIRADGFKVVFSGEGSDELWGSYGFAYHGIKAEGFIPYRRRLFLEQHRKNFARCNKAFLSAGVECRLPFLHAPLVDLAWSLPEAAVRRDGRPKAVLEAAFSDVVPAAILARQKVAFQDGLGMKRAAATAVTDPRAYYRAAYAKLYTPASTLW